jgi:hypothetical protein
MARRARRTVARRLRELGAVREEFAQPLELDRSIERTQLRRMVDARIVRVAPNGNYWLDRERWAEWQRQQILLAIGIMLVAFGVIAALALNSPRHVRQRAAGAPAASADSASPVTR